MMVNPYAANTIRLARVTAVHPAGQKLEVIFLDTGDYGRDVQVVSPYAGTDFGFTGGIPSPEQEGHDPNMEENDPNTRHIVAVVASQQGLHLCLGFIYPQVTQMAFTKALDKNRLIERHTSDFYRSVSDAGDMDMVHPSATEAYLRIGVGSEPDALDGRDYDRRWKRKRNRGTKPSVTLRLGRSTIRMLQDGSVEIHADAGLKISSKGDTEIHADGAINIESGASINMTAAADVIIRAGGTIRHEAMTVYEATENHITTGQHIDRNGKHCPNC